MVKEIIESIDEITAKIEEYKKRNLKMFVSSSFQTHSIPLLHIISKIDSSIPVYFLNTGFHFVETLTFRDQVAKDFGINLISLKSDISRHDQLRNGRFYFTTDIDYCCQINKIRPLENILPMKDIWINGIRREQNNNRCNMREEEKAPHGVIRYHPLLDWTQEMLLSYSAKYSLPEHPLDKSGYASIGCSPCTQKKIGRNSRWFGMNKTECGLHTNLVNR